MANGGPMMPGLPPMPPPLMIPGSGSFDAGAGSLQQYQQSPRQAVPNRGVYMGTGDDGSFMHGHNEISNSLRGSFRGMTESDRGGEAVFLLNNGKDKNDKKNKKLHRSTRKMHMRQKSAQIFMEDVKGTEQLPSCRDIIFLLLFVFHLLGIIYFGKTYGYESETLHDQTAEDSDSSITILYTNLIYIAGLSGIFAVVISGLALLLMTTVARKLVQIALGLAITFSFVWGTMGIGLSPKKVVPATGIIALALTIAYAFIVWDRIPFTAANLHAGLMGIKANPGAVLVAFLFQFLALGWSIYYTFVVVGVYDAIQVGSFEEHFQGMSVLVYVVLGISYYWTLQVFLVRRKHLLFER
jgi:hypothetical protein